MADKQNRLQIAMAVGQQAEDCKFCKLDIDCFEELFDWLTLVDLHSVGQTCKRLRQYACYIFRQTYPGAYVDCKNGDIFIGDVSVNGFCEFIENLSLGEDNMDCFHLIKSKQFKSLKRIEFHNIAFTDEKVDCIKHILVKGAEQESSAVALEDVQLFGCTLDGDFHEKFLQYCPNLKRLSLKAAHLSASEYDEDFMDFLHLKQPFIGDDDSWMLRKYPTLEYFGLGGILYCHEYDNLRTLFEQNPNIRKLVIDPSYGGDFVGLGLEVDNLAIICDDFETDMKDCMYQCLSKAKSFKRLQLYNITALPSDLIPLRDDVRKLEPLEGIEALDKLHGRWSFDLNYVKTMENLNTLCVSSLNREIDAARTLTQLERVSIGVATLMEMEAFIVHLPKLNTITIGTISGNIGNEVPKWNRERERLARACKVTVYVPVNIFLTTKWVACATNSKLVELKRLESYEWDHDFGYPHGRYHR